METTIVYWGYIGIMEKKIETSARFLSFASWTHCSLCQEIEEAESVEDMGIVDGMAAKLHIQEPSTSLDVAIWCG